MSFQTKEAKETGKTASALHVRYQFHFPEKGNVSAFHLRSDGKRLMQSTFGSREFNKDNGP